MSEQECLPLLSHAAFWSHTHHNTKSHISNTQTFSLPYSTTISMEITFPANVLAKIWLKSVIEVVLTLHITFSLLGGYIKVWETPEKNTGKPQMSKVIYYYTSFMNQSWFHCLGGLCKTLKEVILASVYFFLFKPTTDHYKTWNHWETSNKCCGGLYSVRTLG